MKVNEIKAYLKDTLELEKQKLGLERAIHIISNKRFKPRYIKLHRKNTYFGAYMVKAGEKGVWGFLTIVGFLGGFFLSKGDMLKAFLGVFIALVLGLLVIFSVILTVNAMNNREIVSRNSQIQKENKIRYRRSCEKNKLLQVSANKLKKAYLKTDSVLQKMYDLDIICKEYRNIIAVSSIYEYLNSGKAASLKNAYDVYEREIWLERIITKMDTVLQNPEQIANNQNYLYSVIKDIQPEIDAVSNLVIENTDKLNQDAVNTAVNEYIAAVDARIEQVTENNQLCGK